MYLKFSSLFLAFSLHFIHTNILTNFNLEDNNKEKFEIIYPGDQTVASSYRAYSSEVWPEVEFVEQFIKGYVERQTTANRDAGIFEVNLQLYLARSSTVCG